MNSFDFSMYDYSDDATSEQKKEIEEAKVKSHDPFFDPYDTEEIASSTSTPTEEKKYEYEGGKPPWLVKAEKQTFEEKTKELIPFGKGVASGATLGMSEKIPGMKTEEGNELEAGGKFVGATIPISRAAKVADWVLTKVPKVLQPLRFLMHGGITGATYESAVQGAKAARGEEVDLYQVPKTARDFALFTQALGIGASLAERFQNLPKTVQAEIIEDGIIPKNLTKSQYETAEEMINSINNNRPPPPSGGLPPPPPPGAPPGPPPPPIITRRINPEQNTGLFPTPKTIYPSEITDLRNQVGNIFSKNRFYNTTQAGQALKNEIMNIDQDVYRGVNDLYKTSRELHGEINQIHPQLIGQLENRVAQLELIPEPSDVQRRLIRAANNILDDIRTVDEEGNLTGYLDINNQTLIDQIQSLRQIVDYDFAHGDTKNIFRPMIDDLQDAVIGAAEVAGNTEAVDAFADARAGYRAWKENFDNDYVRPFRDASNQDFSKLYKSSQDLDEHNMLKNVLNLSDRGQELMNASTRDIVEKNLSKFFDNPRGANQREFNTAMRELEAIITPEQAQEVKNAFHEAKKRPNIVAKKPPKKPEPEKEIYKEPEDILKEMNTRSGIKRVRKRFSDTQENKDFFEELSQKKMRSWLREGNIDKHSTGTDYAKVLNKEKYHELFSELIGEQKTEELRLLAKKIGDQEVKELSREESKKKLSEKLVGKAIDYKLIELLINLF